MRRILLFLFALIPVWALHAQDFDWKKFHKNFSQVEDNLYASKYETTNGEYKLFLNFIKGLDNEAQVATAMVDTANWTEVLQYSKPFVNYYFQHDAYKEYPVVNISREAAQLYCKWLTQTYNNHPDRKYERVTFRLPTVEEWKKAARGGSKKAIYPWGGPHLSSENGDYLANFTVIRQSDLRLDRGDSCIQYVSSVKTIGSAEASNNNDIEKDLSNHQQRNQAIVTSPVASYKANDIGLFNASGNVAEFVDSGTRHTIGGGWSNTGYFLRIDADDPFSELQESHPSVGFRVFMEVEDKM